MLLTNIILFCILLSAFYPVYIRRNFPSHPKNDLYKTHLALTNVASGCALILLLVLKTPLGLKALALAWKFIYLLISYYLWKKRLPGSKGMLLLSSLSIIFFLIIFNQSFSGRNYLLLAEDLFCAAIISFLIFVMVYRIQKKNILRARRT
ncbi:MAG: hypothetical protein HQL24_04870 [Candidatus Omnitrophica bacterium]|nr:hypothetical protein [Candidatus Omnitrophota bacterium]